jgi:diguanylate cyclase (GGDEF)-like protein
VPLTTGETDEPAARPETGHDDSLGGLVTPIDPLTAETPTLRAYEAFSAAPALYALAIVDEGGVPMGIINRFRFLEQLSRPFGRDLLMHRTVATVMDRAPLVVDEHVPLEQLSEMLVDDGTKYIFDGFIVTRGGRYLGIGTGFSLMRRLTDRRQDALFHLAHHDALTGLPNRQLFRDRLTQALAQAQRQRQLLAVLFIDVDRFKTVNDGLGHAMGDLLLKGVAGRLHDLIRAQDTVARLSGDEFAVVLTNLGLPENGHLVADKLQRILREPHRLDGHEINVSCSIGIAIFPHDGAGDTALMRAADDALYQAKQFRNTCQRYSADMQRTLPDPLLTFSAVRRAIELRQLGVHYQPLVCARTRALHGFEALVRWHDPIQGPRSAAQLIQAAEDAGLIASITDYVVGEAMPRMLAWQRLGERPELRLAVNVSGVEMREGALIPMLERHLAQTGFPPSALELEIIESMVMRSDSSTMAVLRELKQLGIRLSVDDFGTGYSSLSRLQRLPVDGIKIDQTFIHGIGDGRDGNGGAIVQAIIVMAHSLGLTVTAEGIETPAQVTFVEAHDCDRLQGYLISPPLAPAAVEAYLATV